MAGPTGGEWRVAAAAFVTVGSLWVLLVRLLRDKPINDLTDDPHDWNLIDWERDRLQAVAKGLAAFAGTFVTSVFVAVLKDGIADSVPRSWVAVTALGVVGSLCTAVYFAVRASRWARTYR